MTTLSSHVTTLRSHVITLTNHVTTDRELTEVSPVNSVNYLDIISKLLVNLLYIHCTAGLKFVLVDLIISVHSCKLSQ